MERMAYYDQTRRSAPAGDSAPAAGGGGAATGGSAYYSNLCMRAVNQSVGRAIRHRNDYATILFADHRYSREQVRKQLPQWLQPRLTVAGSFGEVQRSLCTFFQAHKKPDTST
jgi:chromosome transmission fidelity protein 1